MKVKVHSLDGDTDFSDLKGDTLAPYLFIDYILRILIDLMKENGFTLKKAGSRWYLVQTMIDKDYPDDIALLTNTPTQTESLLHSLEQVAGGIGLHVNADKTEYICFNLNGGFLKLVDKFTYLRSNISSTENGISMQLVKAWTVVDRLSIIWSQTYPMK